MYCYRRYGHNEGDEPLSPSPIFTRKIDKRPSVAQLYKRELLESGVLSEDDAASLETEFELRLEMTLRGSQSDRERRDGKPDQFSESTAVFQPEYTSASGADGDQRENAEDDRRRPDTRAGGFQRSAEDQTHRARSSRAKSSKTAGRTNGITPRRSRSGRSFSKEFRFDFRARTARAARSARGTRFFTTRKPAHRMCR